MSHCNNDYCFQVINNTLNPVWNQTFDFVIEDGLRDLLMCEVWDHDTFGKVHITFVSPFLFLIYRSLSLIRTMLIVPCLNLSG